MLLPGVALAQSDLRRWWGSIRPTLSDLCQVLTADNPSPFAKQSQFAEHLHSTVSHFALRLRGTYSEGVQLGPQDSWPKLNRT